MDGEAREEDNSLFSYNLARPPSRHMEPNRTNRLRWKLFEKGSEKLNPSQRYELSYDKIKSALLQIREYIERTPCTESQILNDKGFRIFLKDERHQNTKTVKDRGVLYTLLQLSEKQKRSGVIAISIGPFAYSLCYYARFLMPNIEEEEEKQVKIPVTVVIPTPAPYDCYRMKNRYAEMCERLGATVIRNDIHDMTQAHKEALRIAKKEGLVYIDGNDHPNMIIGQATLGIEMIEDMHPALIGAIILPTAVDACGLTAGLAMVIKEINPEIKVIVVHPSVFDPVIDNIRKETDSLDELEVPVTRHVWYKYDRCMPNCWINKTVTVSLMSIANALGLLRSKEMITNFGVAIGLAGILSGKLDELKGKRIIIPHFGEIDWNEMEILSNLNCEPCAGASNA